MGMDVLPRGNKPTESSSCDKGEVGMFIFMVAAGVGLVVILVSTLLGRW